MLPFLIIALLVLGAFLHFTENQPESFGFPLPSRKKTKNKPLMFGRMSCPYTVKMIDELKKNNKFNVFQYVDTTTEEGKKMLDIAGGQGVPHFVSNNGTSASGFMPTNVLFDKLNI